ncbi:MAG: hypothetical protein IAG13_05470 [Deltaproteobacteria bacterium]|nr:hypothetical protein [Nannocystaceae bacterium]
MIMRIGDHRNLALMIAACVGALTGCKEEAGPMGDLVASKTIGPTGGTLSGGGVTLEVPAFALTADTEFELRTSTRDLSARDFTQSGGAFQIFPEELSLRLPAALSFSGGPDEPAVLFEQDSLTVAAMGDSAWINELATVAIARAGVQTTMVVEPPLGATPGEAGAAIRDLARFRVALTETPRFNLGYALYDTEQLYDKPLNGNGDGDCGVELSNVLGGSLAAGCSEGELTARIGVTSAEVQYDVTPYQSGKLATPVVVGVIGGSDELAFQLGFFAIDTSPCYGENCSEVGTCEVVGDQAACTCPDGFAPGPELTCECVPDCAGRACGGDGCGGDCAPGCGDGEVCDDGGQCVPDGSEESGPMETGPMETSSTDPTDPGSTSSGDSGSSSDGGSSSTSI